MPYTKLDFEEMLKCKGKIKLRSRVVLNNLKQSLDMVSIKSVPCLGSLFRREVYAYVYVYLMEYVLASFVNLTQSSIT